MAVSEQVVNEFNGLIQSPARGLTRAWWVFLDAREFAVLLAPYQETVSQWVTQTHGRPEPAEVAAWS